MERLWTNAGSTPAAGTTTRSSLTLWDKKTNLACWNRQGRDDNPRPLAEVHTASVWRKCRTAALDARRLYNRLLEEPGREERMRCAKQLRRLSSFFGWCVDSMNVIHFLIIYSHVCPYVEASSQTMALQLNPLRETFLFPA